MDFLASSDVLKILCRYLDFGTFGSILLSSKEFNKGMTKLVTDDYFFICKIETILSVALPYEITATKSSWSWKRICKAVEKAHQRNKLYCLILSRNVTVVKIALYIGISPTIWKSLPICRAATHGRNDILKLLFEDPRVVRESSDRYYTIMKTGIVRNYKETFDLIAQNLDTGDENISGLLETVCEKGCVETVKSILSRQNLNNPNIVNNALLHASRYGRLEIVKFLLQHPLANPGSWGNEAIVVAASEGRREVIRLLLQDPRVDPSDRNNNAIIIACQENHPKTVQLLLKDPRIDPTDSDNLAIKNACRYGHARVVRILLEDPRIDPCDNDLIYLAAIGNYTYIADMLYVRGARLHEKHEGEEELNDSPYW